MNRAVVMLEHAAALERWVIIGLKTLLQRCKISMWVLRTINKYNRTKMMKSKTCPNYNSWAAAVTHIMRLIFLISITGLAPIAFQTVLCGLFSIGEHNVLQKTWSFLTRFSTQFGRKDLCFCFEWKLHVKTSYQNSKIQQSLGLMIRSDTSKVHF